MISDPKDAMRRDTNKNWQDRLTRHSKNVGKTLEDGDAWMLAFHWFYFILKLLTAILTIYLTCEFFVIVAQVMFTDTSDLSVFVTNTFQATFDYTNNATWPIAVTPDWTGVAFAPSQTGGYGSLQQNVRLYTCMWVAQVGGAPCSASLGSVPQYQTCLQSSSPLYGSSSPNTLITNCQNQGSLSPSDTAYWPTTTTLVSCIANSFNLTRWQSNSFKSCLQHDLPPLYEVAQDVDTPTFLGAFSWPLILLTGVAVQLAFAWYTFYPIDFEDVSRIELGKPRSSFSRMGAAWLAIPGVISLLWFIFVLLIAFRAGSTWPNPNNNLYPSTQQTNVVITTTALALLFYFLLEFCEVYDKRLLRLEPATDENGPVKGSKRMGLPQTIQMSAGRHLGYYFPVTQDIWNQMGLDRAAEMYVPVLAQTWADAYLSDALIFVGAIGATMHGSTVDIYNIFWSLLYYRIAHMGIARLVYHSYVRSPTETEDESAVKDSSGGMSYIAVATTRAFAFSLHIAAVMSLAIVLYIIFDSGRMYSDYSLLQNFVICGLLVPEILRFLGHLLLVTMHSDNAGDKGAYILVFTQFVWFWDLLVRTLFVGLIFWGMNLAVGENGTRGTKPYLLDRFYSLNTMLYFNQFTCSANPALLTYC